ncbi:hypothetical protein BD414DRAFT_424674 [Trametes punicea]|nr:hypothetical protein BD414DRAFT_424674 [Trametes punicea]
MFDASSDSEQYDAYARQLGPNPSLALYRHPKIDQLRSTLNEVLPYCCGTLRLPFDSLIIYYGKTEPARRLDLLHASVQDLDNLEQYCDPATFGVLEKAVLDATYRKAGKLDRDHFAVNLDVERSGLLEAVSLGLFSGREQNRPVRAELHNLNVYGQGSFFKAHKDTPRSTAVFASLVLVFPTPHSGGKLVVRHGGREWSFDPADILSKTEGPESRVAYVAFFGDVEHEVTPVTSGHRLTITYNLYYAFEDPPLDRLDIIEPRATNKSTVQDLLTSLLDDHTFLPNGGIVGFGLRHLYPLPNSFDAHDDHTLDDLKDKLKGVDAAIFRACAELLGSSPSLYTVFEAHSQGGRRALVACPRVVKFHTHDLDEEPPVWEKLCRQWDGVLINFPANELEVAERAPLKNWTVHWVTALTDANRVKTRFAAYGNEPMLGYLYQRICVLVRVGPPGRRREADSGAQT